MYLYIDVLCMYAYVYAYVSVCASVVCVCVCVQYDVQCMYGSMCYVVCECIWSYVSMMLSIYDVVCVVYVISTWMICIECVWLY